MTRDLAIEAKITQMNDAGKIKDSDVDLRMMRDIMGVGVRDIADKNLDYAIEAGQTIALAAVTMGVGALATRLALAGLKR